MEAKALTEGRTYKLALVPCSKTKHPAGITPLTLYRGTQFSVNVRHAKQRCERVIIMSAKHGLVDLDERIGPYNAYLPSLDAFQLAELRTRTKSCLINKKLLEIEPDQILSYLPASYFNFLREVAGADWADRIHRPYKHLPMLTMTKVLSNEIKGWGKTGLARRDTKR